MSRRWFTEEQIARAKRLRDGGYTYQEIADRMGCRKKRIWQLAQRGWKRHTFGDTARPTDLAFRASEMTTIELKRHYRVGGILLARWLAEAGVTLPDRQHRHPIRTAPADFAEVAPTMTHKALQRHYRAGCHTVTRWKVETGVPSPVHDRNARKRRIAESKVGWVERFIAARHSNPKSGGVAPEAM